MKSQKKLTISYLQILTIIIFAYFAHSCVPESGPHNPAEYELDISISSDNGPVVSPNGNLIAYFHECLKYPAPEEYPTGLYVMNMDGTNRRLLLKGYNMSPSWSPDGQWLVISGGTIQIINLDGDSIRTFQGINDVSLYFPDWSQDGKMILMSSPLENGGGVFIFDTQFENIRQMFNSVQFSGFSAQWSPLMDRIIYEKVSHDWDGGEVFIMDTLGINDTRITNDNLDDRNPKLSTKGNMITWSRNVRIMVMNVDGTKQKTLDYGKFPSWSPSSDYIIYSNANNDVTKEVLWKINIDGSNKTQLTY